MYFPIIITLCFDHTKHNIYDDSSQAGYLPQLPVGLQRLEMRVPCKDSYLLCLIHIQQPAICFQRKLNCSHSMETCLQCTFSKLI